jgi:hypothetical protein
MAVEHLKGFKTIIRDKSGMLLSRNNVGIVSQTPGKAAGCSRNRLVPS